MVLALSAGAPPMLTCLLFSIFSGLSGCLTHYGNGSAPVFFESGFVTFKEWWKLGAMIGTIHLILWSSLSLLW
ncbi:MAG: hypothetical protein BGO77_05845 [Caedibacter sp. 37-49]|nr:MAG: hypothetical protein BGO77_05845 [Caedibacter sp. 37-49]